MQSFAEFILNEKDLYKKIETIQNVSKKAPIYFDRVIVFKTLLCKLFIETIEE